MPRPWGAPHAKAPQVAPRGSASVENTPSGHDRPVQCPSRSRSPTRSAAAKAFAPKLERYKAKQVKVEEPDEAPWRHGSQAEDEWQAEEWQAEQWQADAWAQEEEEKKTKDTAPFPPSLP